jgi:FkbM family methyltransferase
MSKRCKKIIGDIKFGYYYAPVYTWPWFLAILLFARISQRIGRLIFWPVIIRYNNQKVIVYLTSGADISTIQEVFWLEEYKLPANFPTPATILDLGANTGFTAVYFSVKYPQAKIVAVEPDPQTFKCLLKNTSAHPNITAINCAVGPTAGEINFYVNKKSSISSSLIDRGEGYEAVTVKALPLSEIIERYFDGKLGLLKFDIEGFEWAMFNDLGEWPHFQNFIGEFHQDITKVAVADFEQLFKNKSYKVSMTPINKERFVVVGETMS